MTLQSKPNRAREIELPPKVHAAISFVRLIMGDMAVERIHGQMKEERVPRPLETTVYEGALLVLLEFFEAPDFRTDEAKHGEGGKVS